MQYSEKINVVVMIYFNKIAIVLLNRMNSLLYIRRCSTWHIQLDVACARIYRLPPTSI
jgi:hypothetical protein